LPDQPWSAAAVHYAARRPLDSWQKCWYFGTVLRPSCVDCTLKERVHLAQFKYSCMTSITSLHISSIIRHECDPFNDGDG